MRGFPLRLTGLVVAAIACAAGLRAADRLPDRLDDAAFRVLVERASEPDGPFQSDNLVSNEDHYQSVIPAARQIVAPGRAYLGVGPEQNFSYIAAFRPTIAFIVDIRRQNTVQLLYYRALFERARDRADFLSRLFARVRPGGLTAATSVDDLLAAYAAAPADEGAHARYVREAIDLLVGRLGFALMPDDRAIVERIATVFRDFGAETNYNSRPGRSGTAGRTVPSFAALMTARAGDGRQWSFLATEEAYRTVRDLQVRNLVVPITGDFGGPRALRTVAQYLAEHDATVGVFYVSNVEQYLFPAADSRGNPNGGSTAFYASVAALPIDGSSVFIRSSNAGGRGGGAAAGRGFVGAAGRTSDLASIALTLQALAGGRIKAYNDLFAILAQ
jgi:hypothetical protein